MFVVLLTYVKPLAEVDRHMRAHMKFLNEQYAARTFVASGRQVPRTGGVILARAASKAALAELLQRDPFVQNGVATFELIEFRTSQHDPAFAPFADDAPFVGGNRVEARTKLADLEGAGEEP